MEMKKKIDHTIPEYEERQKREMFQDRDTYIDDLLNRLNGNYAKGPKVVKGMEPEFGFTRYPTPPIQKEAALLIRKLLLELEWS